MLRLLKNLREPLARIAVVIHDENSRHRDILTRGSMPGDGSRHSSSSLTRCWQGLRCLARAACALHVLVEPGDHFKQRVLNRFAGRISVRFKRESYIPDLPAIAANGVIK